MAPIPHPHPPGSVRFSSPAFAGRSSGLREIGSSGPSGAIVTELLAKGADIEAKDDVGWTALSYAAKNGHDETVTQLLAKCAYIEVGDDRGRTALSYAAENGHDGIVTQLLAKGADIEARDNNGRTPLSWAAMSGHGRTITQLLLKGADVDARDYAGWMPLSWATLSGHEGTITQLLANGADIETRDNIGRTPLSFAAIFRHKKNITQLLENGADIETRDNKGRTPLSLAARNGCEGAITQLLAKGANVETKDYGGRTPLSWAAICRRKRTITQLLAKGAEIEARDNRGRTPLSWAALGGHEGTIIQLLANGADIEARDNVGRTPFSWAAMRMSMKRSSRGYRRRAPTSKRRIIMVRRRSAMPPGTGNSRTPLNQAAQSGPKQTVTQPLATGADIQARNDEVQTTLSYAAENCHDKITQLLVKDSDIEVRDSANYSFHKPRLFSSRIPAAENITTPCNFITFLAAAQKLRISFLPITWEPRRSLLGEGGTSQVNQALIDLETNFAFKRVSDREKLQKSENEIFRRLINEITVLRHPAFWSHPNLLELQGICWDIPPKNSTDATLAYPNIDKTWPVLVFQASHFEDMYQFPSRPIGRELGIKERLKLCMEIGDAVAFMQTNRIIHGDIKPHNVFIFKNDDDFFTAKVADFGFSIWYADAGEYIELHGTRPWDAPECREYGEFTLQQALKADVFSVGMLCLWFLFEKQLSGVSPFPEAIQPDRVSSDYEDKHKSLKFLEHLKKEASLVQFANQLVVAERDLDIETRRMLQYFFSGSLACDPCNRDADMQHSLEHMNIHRTRFIASPVEAYFPADYDFELCYSLHSFYTSDYRLRPYILNRLEEIVADQPSSPLSTQLAACYELGFGLPEGKTLAYNRYDIQVHIEEAVNAEPTDYSGNLYEILGIMGHHSTILLTDHYREHNVLEIAESTTRKEIERLGIILGTKHIIVPTLKSILSSILRCQGQWEEAEKLQVQVMETLKTTFEVDHPDTITSIAGLASTYLDQGRLEEAEKLFLQVMETNKVKHGVDHPSTLTSIADLASTYWNMGRWEEAEKLQVQVLEALKTEFGNDHPSTLKSMSNLALNV